MQERLDPADDELPQSSGMSVMLQPLSSTSRVMKFGRWSEIYGIMDPKRHASQRTKASNTGSTLQLAGLCYRYTVRYPISQW